MAHFSIRKGKPMKDKPHKYSDDRKRGHVKRKYEAAEPGTEPKRIKQVQNNALLIYLPFRILLRRY